MSTPDNRRRTQRPATTAPAATRTARSRAAAGATGAGSSGGSGRRTSRRRRRIWPWIVFPLLALLVLVVGGFTYLYMTTPIPEANKIAMAQTSIVYYADGKTEMGRIGQVDGEAINREVIALKDVPDHVQKAMLAAEDKEFYSNAGISPTGLARAVWNMARGQSTQGGSTITQQFVKNYYLTQDQTITRKAKELVLSLKIERELSKDQILENYLNTIYYGRGAYGIKTAAQAYFGKTPKQLTVAEGALLASVINAPSAYDPALGPKAKARAQARVTYVLGNMVEKGWLTAAQKAKATFPATNAIKKSSTRRGPNGYLLDVAVQEITGEGIVSEDELNRGGLRVVTTIDAKTQQKAVDAVEAGRPSGSRGDKVHVALTSVNPKNGEILAMYGGRDYATQQFNDATQGAMQAGSTFKVFTLIAALEKGISTRSMIDGRASSGSDIPGFGNTKIKNFGGSAGSMMTVKQATARSNNVAYAHLNAEVGGAATKAAAIKLGVSDDSPGLNDELINVLGTASVSSVDMASAFATIANGGKHVRPHIVRSLKSADGLITYTAEPDVQQAISADVAADATDALGAVIQGGSGASASIGRPAAGKTGTSSNNMSAWFDGFIPQVATSVGLFLPDAKGNPQPMTNVGGRSEVTGGSFPAAIWHDYMRAVAEGMDVENFPPRAGVGDDQVIANNPTPEQPSATDVPTQSPTQSPSPSATPSTSATPSEPPTPSQPAPSQPTTPAPAPSTPPAPSQPSGGGGTATPGGGGASPGAVGTPGAAGSAGAPPTPSAADARELAPTARTSSGTPLAA